MKIDWYDRPESKIIFKGVYLFKAEMNFGIIATESILNAEILPSDDPDLVDFCNKIKINHTEVNGYMIETNSTGGIMKIIAATVEEVG